MKKNFLIIIFSCTMLTGLFSMSQPDISRETLGWDIEGTVKGLVEKFIVPYINEIKGTISKFTATVDTQIKNKFEEHKEKIDKILENKTKEYTEKIDKIFTKKTNDFLNQIEQKVNEMLQKLE
ncbi:MAG: hypothetical protein ABIA74_05130 [bacterium]